MDKTKCDTIYQKLDCLYPTNDSSWDSLRELIQEVKNITKGSKINLYNNDLEYFYSMSWNGSKNSSTKNFLHIKQELKVAILDISHRLEN